MKKLITTFVATSFLLASNAIAVSFEIGFNDANGTILTLLVLAETQLVNGTLVEHLHKQLDLIPLEV